MTTIIDYLEKHKQNSPEKIFIQIDSQNWTYENVYDEVIKIYKENYTNKKDDV